ncbi:MAG: hypothetical protein H0W72_12430 [Planctomycetes bacterium]|nr:hypothetical protein [Planctomycetota bacterium]
MTAQAARTTRITRRFSKRPRFPRWITAVAAAAALAVVWFAMPDFGARARIRRVQACIDERIDATRDLGTVLGQHPHLKHVRWAGNWAGDDRAVVAIVGVERLDKVPASLIAVFQSHVGRVVEWSGIAGDQPAAMTIVFRWDDTATPPAQVVDVRMTEAWAIYRPELVAEQEKALDEAVAQVGNRSEASRYRLRHDGDRALFDAGIHAPILAGPGQSTTARDWLAALAAWR